MSVLGRTTLSLVLLLVLVCAIGAEDEGGPVCSDDVNQVSGCPWDLKLTVVVLTMNRPRALARLLQSLVETDLSDWEDSSKGGGASTSVPFNVEIHVDKAVGTPHEECVR